MTAQFAFIFPGQASQRIGMLAEVMGEPLVQSTFSESSDILGCDLNELVAQGPEEKLNSTEWTQPVILTASVALWRLWCDREGLKPSCMAGHSLGEYSALVCAGALDFSDAVQLVHQRGLFMSNAVPQGEGLMAAILGLEDQLVESICQQVAGEEVVEAVNFNAPGQVVIAGHTQAVQRAMEKTSLEGGKAIGLTVSVPSHCELMLTAAEQFADHLRKITLKKAEVPVYHNVDALTCCDTQESYDRLIKQLHSPVRWVESIRNMVLNHSIQLFLECGPGKVLTGLNKRIDRKLGGISLELPKNFELALEKSKTLELNK